MFRASKPCADGAGRAQEEPTALQVIEVRIRRFGSSVLGALHQRLSYFT